MFKWQKQGRIFIPQEVEGIDWIKEFAQAPDVLVFDKYIRVYFACRPPRDTNGQYVSYTGYIDLERKNLFNILDISNKPVLELGKTGFFDEFGTYPTTIIRKDNSVICYYAGWTRCESVPFNVAIGKGISYDNGKTFQKIGNAGPVLSYSLDEPFVISGPKIRFYNNKYYLFYIAGKKWIPTDIRPEPVYRIRLAISDDGVNWQKVGKDLIDIKIEEDECQASPDVFFSNGLYHMFFCYRKSLNYKGKEGGYRIGYAQSKDLINWVRRDELVGIDVSEEGWDSEMVAYPHVFSLDGSIYMLYIGNEVGRFGLGIAKNEEFTNVEL